MADASEIPAASQTGPRADLTGDNADWAFLALTPILIAATMLAAAAAFADVEPAKTGTPVAAATQAERTLLQN